jgi:hypothetical protein
MMRSHASIRRLSASRLSVRPFRSYHASGMLGADALDMTDTFARRHSESNVIVDPRD